MKQILPKLIGLVVFIFGTVNTACTSYQSKEKCLGSSYGCCWYDFKYKGEQINMCFEHFFEGDDSENFYIPESMDVTERNIECSDKVNTCINYDGIEDSLDKCLKSSDDCCRYHMVMEYQSKEEKGEEKIDYCFPNTVGTEKGYSTSTQNLESNVEIEEYGVSTKMKEFSIKCKENKETFYSKCYEQGSAGDCLKAESNCCWVTVDLNYNTDYSGIKGGAKNANCEFNFLKTATLYKEYAKSSKDTLNNILGDMVNYKYDVRCNLHDYALFGGSGKVVKDGKNPIISFDSDVTGKKGEQKLSEALKEVSASNIQLTLKLGFVLIALILF